jgi:hypothetical protein
VSPISRTARTARGGTWGDFAYGPGEADIVHLSAPRPFDGTTFNPAWTAEALRENVEIVRLATPDVPIYVSTSPPPWPSPAGVSSWPGSVGRQG